ncbi:MAG: RDD family protein [Actinobacteria bacterium]|nr:RDD family protein [Actinomycetota bacterium]
MIFKRVSLSRRLTALAIDWAMSLAIASLFTSRSTGLSAFAPLGVFFLEVWILTSLSAASAGQRLVRIRVIRFADGGSPTPTQVLIRTALLCLVVTAVTFDENGRGLHERISGTVLTR